LLCAASTSPPPRAPFTLALQNGDDAGNNKVSSATVKVNGATIVRQSDFNQQVVWLNKPLTNLVPGSNNLSVEVSNKSTTSSFVTVTITGDYLLNVTITVPTSARERLIEAYAWAKLAAETAKDNSAVSIGSKEKMENIKTEARARGIPVAVLEKEAVKIERDIMSSGKRT